MKHMTAGCIALCCGLFVGIGSVTAAPCPCNGNVNNDTIVNVLDALCIIECQNGDCSCCINSCDINCDGVVDQLDVNADDPVNIDNTWLCLFAGGSAETCCPVIVTGACCNTTTGTCAGAVQEAECTATNEIWTEATDCANVTCQAPTTGACCDTSTGGCDNGVLQSACTGASLTWTEGANCAGVFCPTPPIGACCNLGNGLCEDEVFQPVCSGPDFVWTPGTACTAISCSVPPQTPCTCNGNVNNDTTVNVVDAVCIFECQNGDCSCCINSCDINCDGVVDQLDANADDPVNIDSTWLCEFVGGSPESCCSAEFQTQLGQTPAIPATTDWTMLGFFTGMAAFTAFIVRSRKPSMTFESAGD